MAGLTREQKKEKFNLKKYVSHKKSYKWNDDFIEIYSNNEQWSSEMQLAYRPPKSKIIENGSWIMVLRNVPVSPVKPNLWHIYWATPCKESHNFDGYGPDGRYKIEITVPSSDGSACVVGLFPHEYMVVDEENLKLILDEGEYQLRELSFATEEDDLDLKLIERGRALTEEEREIIWALQLDGLPEAQACSEYFCSRHINKDNVGIMYVPNKEYANYLTNCFIR